ncbi:MAG TPA: hypothetical protein VEH04_04530, partial [Verrucomicrobiae bacterium]|nr:hypothetical protein [Verrucomicrobiae bacterium]
FLNCLLLHSARPLVVTSLPTLPAAMAKKLLAISSNVFILGKENLAIPMRDHGSCGFVTTDGRKLMLLEQ